jgi:hypothetical protein
MADIDRYRELPMAGGTIHRLLCNEAIRAGLRPYGRRRIAIINSIEYDRFSVRVAKTHPDNAF